MGWKDCIYSIKTNENSILLPIEGMCVFALPLFALKNLDTVSGDLLQDVGESESQHADINKAVLSSGYEISELASYDTAQLIGMTISNSIKVCLSTCTRRTISRDTAIGGQKMEGFILVLQPYNYIFKRPSLNLSHVAVVHYKTE